MEYFMALFLIAFLVATIVDCYDTLRGNDDER